MILSQLRSAITFIGVFSVITGIIYPLFITGVAQLLFPLQANGSMLKNNGTVIGSSLIGQQFTLPKYFKGRPSATQPTPYNPLGSAGSNLSPTNPELILAVKSRVDALIKENPDAGMPVPLDLVTSSASGLDPHISINGALFQVKRISKQRKISSKDIESLIIKHSNNNSINVLELNLALDALSE